jgi:uncharacterized protein (AIM24 family)
MYMTDGIEMATSTGGGVGKALSRMMTGQNLFLTDYRYTKTDGKSGKVALGTNFPSKIMRLSIAKYGGKLVCQKGALLCASHTVDIQMEYSKNLTTGFFGGEGFILQVRSIVLDSMLRRQWWRQAMLPVVNLTRGSRSNIVSIEWGFPLLPTTGPNRRWRRIPQGRRELADGERLRISSGCLVAFSNGVDYGS